MSSTIGRGSKSSNSSFDEYFVGSDGFYFNRQTRYRPYTPYHFPIEWNGYEGAIHQMALQMRGAPKNLEEACATGNLGYVVMFWAQGQSVGGGSITFSGNTPLMAAAYKGHLHVVRFLVDAGVDINAVNSTGSTALHMAASAVNYHVVQFLLDHGADPTRRNFQGYSAYFSAVQSGSLPLLLMLAEHRPVDINERDEAGHTLIQWAAYNNSVAICQYLVEVCKADVNAVCADGRTALMWAAREGYAEVVEYLLSEGASADTVDSAGYTAADYTRYRNHPEARYVLDNYSVSQRKSTVEATSNKLLVNSPRTNGRYATVHSLRNRGTLSMMWHQPLFALTGVVGIASVLGMYVLVMLIPPFFSYFVFALFFLRNALWIMVLDFPEQSGKPALTIIERVGIGRSFTDTVRGTWRFRDRDAAPLLALFTFVLLQMRAWAHMGLKPFIPLFSVETPVLVPLVKAKLVATDVQGDSGDGPSFLRSVMCFLTIALLCSVVLCKLLSMRSVYRCQRGSLTTSPIWKILKRRAYDWLHPRIIFMERHLVLPLRAFYCYEMDIVIERYDGYSAALDCPVAAGNHVWFFSALGCFSFLQWLIFFCVWSETRERLQCPQKDSLGEYIFSPVWNLLWYGLPCADPTPVDVTGKSLLWGFMLRYIVPTTASRLGVWLLHYTLVAAIIATFCFFRQLVVAATGATRMELANPTATSGSGGLVSIFPPGYVPSTSPIVAAAPWTPPEGHCEGMLTIIDDYPLAGSKSWDDGSHCIYADSRFSVVNIVYFLLGISGRRWNGAIAVSSFNSPISNVSLLESPTD